MQNKLQELTDKLYAEGLAKGKNEGEEILRKAKEEAAAIIKEAENQAAEIIANAEKEVSQMRSKVENDIKMASVQALAEVRQKAENSIIASAAGAPVKASFSDTAFVKSLITEVVKAFNAADPQAKSLDLVLPSQTVQELGERFAAEISQTMGNTLCVKGVKGMPAGFKIGPSEGGYLISFTEDDFASLIGEYLRPATKKLLFG